MTAPDGNIPRIMAAAHARGLSRAQTRALCNPKLVVIEDILREILKPHGIALPPVDLAAMLPDPLKNPSLIPNLNHPAATNLVNRQDHVCHAFFT